MNVFRSVADQYVGQISVFKVLSTVNSDVVLVDHATDEDVKLHAPFRLIGTEHAPAQTLVAGDIGAVAKLSVPTGCTLSVRSRPVLLERAALPEPHYAVALNPVACS